MKILENRMVVDAEWRPIECVHEELGKTTNPGYTEISTRIHVSEEDAFDYALDRCLQGTENDKKEFREMLVEWYYSGGEWVKEKNKQED